MKKPGRALLHGTGHVGVIRSNYIVRTDVAEPIVAYAQNYLGRGWCVIPIKPKSKKPVCQSWKEYQQQRPTESDVERWWAKPGNGIAIVHGPVSDGMTARDFDEADAYHQWAAEWPDLAQTLPTVQTARGFHVYCRATPESVQKARNAIGRPDGHGAIDCGDGELRCGCGCFTVLPPSTHPDGHRYRWTVAPGLSIPELDITAIGWLPATATQEDTGDSGELRGTQWEHRRHNDVDGVCTSPKIRTIDELIRDTQPTGKGQRHTRLFLLARGLKFGGYGFEKATDCLEVVRRWWGESKEVIRTTDWDTNWLEFCESYDAAKYALGEDPRHLALQLAKEQPPPAAKERSRPEVMLLIGLCYHLQNLVGDESFFLSCRSAGEMVGMDHSTASRWLKQFIREGLLKLVKAGQQGSNGKASEYRWIA